MPKLWLPPKVWLQGSQSAITVEQGAKLRVDGSTRGLVMLAPKIDAHGEFVAEGQDVAFVTASDDASASARSQAAADIAFEDQGFPGSGDLTVECSGSPCLTPGATITTRASVSVPLPLVPAVLGLDQLARVPVEAVSVQRVSRFWGTAP